MKVFSVRISFFLLFIFLWTVAPPAQGQKTDTKRQTLSNSQAELLLQQKKMKRLQMGMEGQKQLIRSSTRQESRLLDDLAIIDTKLQNERNKLRDMRAKLAAQEKTLAENRQTLSKLLTEKEAARAHIKTRLAAYYRIGQTGLLNAIFSSSGLAELLRFDTYYQSMVKHDNQTLINYKEKIRQINETTEAVKRQKKILIAFIADVAAQEQQLNALRLKRQALLERVQTEKELFKSALAEISEAAVKLTATIARLKKEALQERQQQLIKKQKDAMTSAKIAGKIQPRWPPFENQKGKLSPPLHGAVTKLFGKSATEKFGLTLQANGITIANKPGSAIRAVYHGKVVFVGQLKGYGNLLIIDHGGQYYSLVARSEQYYKKKDDIVMSGEVIGITGESAGLLEDGLHFEVRHGTEPMNPLDWLKPGSLVVAAKK